MMKKNYISLIDKSRLSKHVLDEMNYHDKVAGLFIQTSKKDLIWQVPEEMVFVKYLSSNNNWVLLDIGCGPAENIKRNILPKMKKGDVYIGVDVSERLLCKARQNIPNGTFILSAMNDLAMPKMKIDYLCFFGALHHDEAPEQTLAKLAKFITPGGFIFLREPQRRAFKKGEGASPHEAGIDPANLRKWLLDSDFKVLEWHFFDTAFFHLARRLLVKLRLDRWEEKVFFWKVKVWLEVMLEKILVGFLDRWQGTDMFIVARKKNK